MRRHAYLTLRSSSRRSESVEPTGTSVDQERSIYSSWQSNQTHLRHFLLHWADCQSPQQTQLSLQIRLCLISPLSCGCVLAMIHFTRQHFISAFLENRGFCHFPDCFARLGAGSTPLASPSRLPSTTLPSAWREERTEGKREREREREKKRVQDTVETELRSLKETRAYVWLENGL